MLLIQCIFRYIQQSPEGPYHPSPFYLRAGQLARPAGKQPQCVLYVRIHQCVFAKQRVVGPQMGIGLFIKATRVKALPREEMFPRRVNATLPREDRGKLNAPRWGKIP